MNYLEEYFDERDKKFEKRFIEILKEYLDSQSRNKAETRKWVRTDEAMNVLACSKSQLQRYKNKDKIVFKKLGNTCYYLHQSLIELIESA
jgi:hypothetical protein